MRGLGITPKQRRYANNLMNTELSRRQALQQAGYSESMSNKPMKVENSNGFKLAMAGIFAQSGNVSMAILNEMDAKIQAGELAKQDMRSLIGYFDVMTRAMERIAPKESSATLDDVSRIFAGVVGQEIPVDNSVDNLDNESQEMSSNTLTDIVKDSIVNDVDSQTLHHEKGEQSSEPLTDSPASGIE